MGTLIQALKNIIFGKKDVVQCATENKSSDVKDEEEWEEIGSWCTNTDGTKLGTKEKTPWYITYHYEYRNKKTGVKKVVSRDALL